MSQGLRLALLGVLPLAILLLGLFLFHAVLLPFLVGMAAAYLLDPVADRLERSGLGRGLATALITTSFFLALVVVLVLLVPPLATQAAELAAALPGYLEDLRNRIVPWLTGLLAQNRARTRSQRKRARPALCQPDHGRARDRGRGLAAVRRGAPEPDCPGVRDPGGHLLPCSAIGIAWSGGSGPGSRRT